MSIDKWKELNKDWLCNYNNLPEGKGSSERWLLGREEFSSIERSDLWFYRIEAVLYLDTGGPFIDYFRYQIGTGKTGGNLLKYFRDWKRPTQQEKDMYEMLTGVKIMWSEEFPFKTLEDE